MTAQGPNEPSKLTEQLLDAARAERPSPALSDSVRAAVERGDPPRASPPKGPLRWPWIAGGAIALVLVGWSVTRFGPTEATADVRTTASVDDTAPPPTPALPQLAESIDAGDEAAPDAGALPTAAVAAPPDAGQRAPTRRTNEPREDADALEAELALIETARGQVRAEPQRALDTLTVHARRFPRGALQKERVLLQVEALLRAQRRPEAERLAQRWLSQPTPDLFTERLRRLLSDGPAP